MESLKIGQTVNLEGLQTAELSSLPPDVTRWAESAQTLEGGAFILIRYGARYALYRGSDWHMVATFRAAEGPGQYRVLWVP